MPPRWVVDARRDVRGATVENPVIHHERVPGSRRLAPVGPVPERRATATHRWDNEHDRRAIAHAASSFFYLSMPLARDVSFAFSRGPSASCRANARQDGATARRARRFIRAEYRRGWPPRILVPTAKRCSRFPPPCRPRRSWTPVCDTSPTSGRPSLAARRCR